MTPVMVSLIPQWYWAETFSYHIICSSFAPIRPDHQTCLISSCHMATMLNIKRSGLGATSNFEWNRRDRRDDTWWLLVHSLYWVCWHTKHAFSLPVVSAMTMLPAGEKPRFNLPSPLSCLKGCRHVGCPAETAHLRHHQCVGGNWTHWEEVKEQHSVEVSQSVCWFCICVFVSVIHLLMGLSFN